MAYPSTHKLTVVHVSAHSPSIGVSPVAAYLRVPFRCSLEKLTVVANAAPSKKTSRTRTRRGRSLSRPTKPRPFRAARQSNPRLKAQISRPPEIERKAPPERGSSLHSGLKLQS